MRRDLVGFVTWRGVGFKSVRRLWGGPGRDSGKGFGATALVAWFFSIVMLLAWSGPLWAETVRVAIAAPMIGTSYVVGVQYEVGVTAALKALPDGKLLGRPVEFSLHDDGCAPTLAEAVALELVEHPPALVVGHSCSGATIAAAPIYPESVTKLGCTLSAGVFATKWAGRGDGRAYGEPSRSDSMALYT